MEHDCTVLKKGKSASRTLLRLHRAMEFFAAFVDKVMDMDAGGSAANAAQEAYKWVEARRPAAPCPCARVPGTPRHGRRPLSALPDPPAPSPESERR